MFIKKDYVLLYMLFFCLPLWTFPSRPVHYMQWNLFNSSVHTSLYAGAINSEPIYMDQHYTFLLPEGIALLSSTKILFPS